jgi:hypothetical protein
VTVTAGAAATLPHGLWADGVRRCDAELRPLTGADEEFLLDAGSSLLPAERTTALLERCLLRLGPHAPAGAEQVRSLVVGDREALLLQLRRLTLGDRLLCVATCPACGEQLDVELRVGDLLLEPYGDAPERHEGLGVVYRAVTGADQEAGARLARDDLAAAERAVLGRCVEAGELTDAVARDLPALLADADPQAQLVLRTACAACGEGFAVDLDVGAYLERELAGERDALYREVHVLASHYHWSEAELLALTPAKRRRYLGLVAGGEEGLG